MEAGRTYYVQAAASGSSTGRYTLAVVADDFGNTFEDSSPIELDGTGAGSQSGAIETAGDVDMFRFVAPMTGRLTVMQVADTASSSSLDSLLTAYDDTGTQLAQNDDSGPDTLDSLVEFAVEAGRTYYVQAAASGSSTGRYTLAVVASNWTTTRQGILTSPGDFNLFEIDPTTDGRLVARVHAEGATTRLSLLDAQGQVLMQSDGQSPDNRDDLIDLHVPAGTDYLEVENLGGTGAYTLTTTLTPATTPFQPIPVGSRSSGHRGGRLQRRWPDRPRRRQRPLR